MTVRLAHSTARAVLDQMRNGGRSDMTLMLGENATAPGFCADETAVLNQLQGALSGADPGVTATAMRHLHGVSSTAIDVALLGSTGLDVAVAAYQVAAMGALTCRAGGQQIQITADGTGSRRLSYDIPLGDDATWSTGPDGIFVTIHRLPETVSTALASRIAGEEGALMLRTVVAHPLLDPIDLEIARAKSLAWGGVHLLIAGGDALEDRPLSALLKT